MERLRPQVPQLLKAEPCLEPRLSAFQSAILVPLFNVKLCLCVYSESMLVSLKCQAPNRLLKDTCKGPESSRCWKLDSKPITITKSIR